MASKKRRSSSSSSYGSLPKDIVIDILKRCPIKPLMRFKCVSKSWCSLIQDPTYVDSFLKSQRVLNVGCFKDKGKIAQLYSINGEGVATQTSIFARDFAREFKFCNGLVCFRNNSPTSTSESYKQLIVCNLSTQKYVNLPRLENYSMDFDFGFDSVKKEYKVLAWDCANYVVLLFTLGTNSWRQVKNRPRDRFHAFYAKLKYSFCMEGTFYWFCNNEYIISFNLANELFGRMEGPKRISRGINKRVAHLFEFDGCLCVIDHHDFRFGIVDHTKILDLWMLEEKYDKKVWVLTTRITLPTICADLHIPLPYSTRTGEIVLGVSTVDGSSVIYLYNFLTKKIATVSMAGLGSCFIVSNFNENFYDLEDL